MQLYDDLFVKAAYPLLLGRKADRAGTDCYTARLHEGHSRISIIDQMVRSAEARPDWAELPGLRGALKRYHASRRLSGWKLALRDPELGRLPSQRRARSLANALGPSGKCCCAR
jgi:hypothetical protein